MKTISKEEIKKLKAQGVKVRNEKGGIVVTEEPVRFEPKKKEKPDLSAQVLAHAKEMIATNTAMVVKVLEEVTKPIPKRKTQYKVKYKNKQIDTVTATEL